jgi:hypothetical protein
MNIIEIYIAVCELCVDSQKGVDLQDCPVWSCGQIRDIQPVRTEPETNSLKLDDLRDPSVRTAAISIDNSFLAVKIDEKAAVVPTLGAHEPDG